MHGADSGNATLIGTAPGARGCDVATSPGAAAALSRKPRLRRWQQEAARSWAETGRPEDFLVEATPGAGKTAFALHLAQGALAAHHVETCTVVCPTTHLRRQWQIAAHRAGIELCSEVAGARLDRAFRGAVLTYQQVLSEPGRYRRMLGAGWVILDECHHAGEGRSWADALAHAFGEARHRLSLSGTAFRSDDCRIPFIRYDADGVSAADYRYGYGEALKDGVVRPVYFVSFGGETTWYKGGQKRHAAFDHALPREEAAARLRTALDAGGGWMGHALERAHRRLLDIRLRGHADAGGLVVCMDQAHARKVADRLRHLTGITPAVALSDDPDASAVISRFAAGRGAWIVAVRQVSEGTDIPRLRVGVWATNASTELFFRQVVGRLVRVVPGLPEQDAYLYLPADPGLLRHARALSDERSHHLPERSADDDVEIERARVVAGDEGDFQALGSTGNDWEIVVGSRVLAPAELDHARAVAADCGLGLDDPLPFALALREATGPGAVGDIPLEARRRALRSLLARRVREYCARTGASHRDVYARLKRQAGKAVGRLNELALVRHLRTVDGWLAHARSAAPPAPAQGSWA
jgi:superfamily II DNA or RNA helicase